MAEHIALDDDMYVRLVLGEPFCTIVRVVRYSSAKAGTLVQIQYGAPRVCSLMVRAESS